MEKLGQSGSSDHVILDSGTLGFGSVRLAICSLRYCTSLDDKTAGR